MTSEEIVRSLRICATSLSCAGCAQLEQLDAPDCHQFLASETADLIERLEQEKAALLEYAKKSAGCAQCANYRPECTVADCFFCLEDCQCKKCKKGSKWEWKGLDDEQ